MVHVSMYVYLWTRFTTPFSCTNKEASHFLGEGDMAVFCLFGLECAFVHSFWDRDQPILLSFPNVPSFVIEIHFLLWTLMDLYPVMSFEPTSRLIHSIILGSVEPTWKAWPFVSGLERCFEEERFEDRINWQLNPWRNKELFVKAFN